jgi:hypothetical protein
MPTYRKQHGGYASSNGLMLEEGWGIFRRLIPGKDYDLPPGEEPWEEELIAVVGTETMADRLLAVLPHLPILTREGWLRLTRRAHRDGGQGRSVDSHIVDKLRGLFGKEPW